MPKTAASRPAGEVFMYGGVTVRQILVYGGKAGNSALE